jgi:hypothetical protein
MTKLKLSLYQYSFILEHCIEIESLLKGQHSTTILAILKDYVRNEFNGIYNHTGYLFGEIEFTSEEDITLFLLKV